MKKKKKRRKNEKSSDRNENWYQGQFRYGEFKNRGPKSRKSLEESEEEEKEEKTKNTRNNLKFGTHTKIGTTNSKIVVPSSKNHQVDHTHAPPLKKSKSSNRPKNGY